MDVMWLCKWGCCCRCDGLVWLCVVECEMVGVM